MIRTLSPVINPYSVPKVFYSSTMRLSSKVRSYDVRELPYLYVEQLGIELNDSSKTRLFETYI